MTPEEHVARFERSVQSRASDRQGRDVVDFCTWYRAACIDMVRAAVEEAERRMGAPLPCGHPQACGEPCESAAPGAELASLASGVVCIRCLSCARTRTAVEEVEARVRREEVDPLIVTELGYVGVCDLVGCDRTPKALEARLRKLGVIRECLAAIRGRKEKDK